MPPPKAFVCVGGGGVGKTSTSAGLALALARAGHRTLIVTIDPARRLAGAMGVPISHVVTPVPLDPLGGPQGGSLSALMPDPRRSAETFVDILFSDERAAGDRVRQSRLFRALSDAVAGLHEIVALSVLADACERGSFDAVVIDTAPSRDALTFVRTPARLSDLLGGRAVSFLAGLAARAESTRRGGILSRLGGGIDALLAQVVGPNLLSETAALFTELGRVRLRFVALASQASELLLGPRATWLLVGAPTAAARDDVVFLAEHLRELGREPRAILLNRAERGDAGWLEALGELPSALDAVRQELAGELAARQAASDAAIVDLSGRLRGVPLHPLPVLEDLDPPAIVRQLAAALGPLLPQLTPD
jgi:anion-transporting  ArsA/GET3 family ATPase